MFWKHDLKVKFDLSENGVFKTRFQGRVVLSKNYDFKTKCL